MKGEKEEKEIRISAMVAHRNKFMKRIKDI